MKLALPFLLAALACAQTLNTKDDGYRGIWYFNQPSGDRYVYKYSGGFATYPQQHAPIAIYSKEANKTFFCYGGTVEGKRELLHMVSYYDHSTGEVPRPTILLNKQTEDAHDNPTLSIDGQGHLWIFSSAHGTSRPSYLHRSRKPYSIDAFDLILKTNFSYPQPWYVPGEGFLFLHTRYGGGRGLNWMTSLNGREWSEPQLLAHAEQGHYQVSWPDGGRIGTAFDVHPPPLGLNQRTNLYYLETRDMGRTWRTAQGTRVDVPLRSMDNPALIRDFRKEGLLVYLKDLQYDARHRPVILFLTSKGYQSGPANDPRVLMLARWTGQEWVWTRLTTADHNYDHGSFYIEENGTWRFIGPAAGGPQPYGTGGEIEMWTSRDEGRTWTLAKRLTQNSPYSHTYVRRPLNAHPGFYAFWADGNAFAPSKSRLYFAGREGSVFQLPARMSAEREKPRRIR